MIRRAATLDGALWELHLHLIKLKKAQKDIDGARIARQSADAHALARRLYGTNGSAAWAAYDDGGGRAGCAGDGFTGTGAGG